MARVIILSTCDEWKSYASFRLYGTWASSKAGCRRLFKTIIKGIKEGLFVYENEDISCEEQIKNFMEDEKRKCLTTFLYDLQSKLIYGNLEMSELR